MDDTPVSAAEGAQLETDFKKTKEDIISKAADDFLDRSVIFFKYGDDDLTDKIANQPMMKDGSARMFHYSAGLDATRDPRKKQSPLRMKASADEEHLKSSVTVTTALMTDADTAYFISGLHWEPLRYCITTVAATLNQQNS